MILFEDLISANEGKTLEFKESAQSLQGIIKGEVQERLVKPLFILTCIKFDLINHHDNININ